MKERRARVLELVAEAYIATAHPVASSHIAAQLEVSPATVRYDFGSLEDAGLLQQPHTSAGRIPTVLGFRTYAAGFLPPKPLAAPQRARLDERLKGAVGDDLFNLASRLAAELSGYAVTLRLPADATMNILEIHLSPLSASRMLAVVVLENGLVRQLGVTVDPIPTDDVIDDAERNLRQLSQPVGEVPAALLDIAKRAGAELSRTLQALAAAWSDLHPPRVFREGIGRLLAEPEGADPAFVRSALEQLEEDTPATDDASLTLEVDDRVARLCAAFALGRTTGQLTLVGPARMRYGEAFSVAQGLARALERPHAHGAVSG